jgi:hypothetical protein
MGFAPWTNQKERAGETRHQTLAYRRQIHFPPIDVAADLFFHDLHEKQKLQEWPLGLDGGLGQHGLLLLLPSFFFCLLYSLDGSADTN